MKQYFVTSTGTTSLGRGETPFRIDAPQDVGIERDTLSLNIQVRRLPGGPETSNSAASQQIQVTVFLVRGSIEQLRGWRRFDTSHHTMFPQFTWRVRQRYKNGHEWKTSHTPRVLPMTSPTPAASYLLVPGAQLQQSQQSQHKAGMGIWMYLELVLVGWVYSARLQDCLGCRCYLYMQRYSRTHIYNIYTHTYVYRVTLCVSSGGCQIGCLPIYSGSDLNSANLSRLEFYQFSILEFRESNLSHFAPKTGYWHLLTW